MTSSKAGVLLDVDGTLVDTNYLHTLAWSRAFRDAGEWAPMNSIHRLVGMGGDQLVPRVLGHESPDANERRSTRYKELMPEAVAFPMARELILRLHHEGLAVVLASSSPDDEVAYARELIGADEGIDGETRREQIEHTKPAPDIFEAALRVAGIDRFSAVVVGDSIWDVEAAGAAGLPCVGLETGGFSEHELISCGAVAVYRDVADLVEKLGSSPISRLVAASR